MSSPVRTIVAFTNNSYRQSIPDLVLYINTDTGKLCYNKDGVVYVVELLSTDGE